MLNFGNSGAGAGGSQLWKFISGAAPDDIELNTGAGVTGIDALNPQEAVLRLISKNLPADNTKQFTGEYCEYRNQIHANGIISEVDGLSKRINPFLAQLTDAGTINQKTTIVDMDINNHDFAITIDDLVNYSVRNSKVNRINDITVDTNTGSGTEFLQTQQEYSYKIYSGGSQVAALYITPNEIRIEDTANNPVFKIKNNGNIQTNQAVAPAVRGLKINDLPIYDTAGSLLGYIPIFAP